LATGLRELKDHLGNHVRNGVGLVFELKRFARHPVGHAHGFPSAET
jgi:hypothetical protein